MGRRSSPKVHLHIVAKSPLVFSFWFPEKEPEAVPSSWHIRDTVPENESSVRLGNANIPSQRFPHP